ncbi:MAG: Ig-like domain-containing protein, partial [Promethearchaeota archaeon]
AFPYVHDFNDGFNGWSYNGTGWGMLNQSNQNDNRSTLYSENWSALYFGRDHDFPLNYTYQPYIITNPFPNGSLRSPLFNITHINKNYTQVVAKIGLRTSLNTGDFMYLQINPNWTGWITLRTYSGEERDWFLEEINITQYIGNYVQFRFVAVIDEDFDPINYKGFALAYFSLENYTNFQTPEIDFNVDENISSLQGFKYDRITFSLNYFDSDNNYPEYVFIEINNQNYSMINVFGAWNASLGSVDSRGIKFVRSIVLNDFTNLTFRFHVYDGKFLKSTNFFNPENNLFNFQNPIANEFNVNQNGKLIGFDYALASLSDYYITGNPMQKELTQWLKGDNSWHLYYRFGNPFIYGGLGQSYGSLSRGYESDWDASLITYPLHVRDEYDVILNFAYEISLQNEFFLEQDELDKCTISISSNYGESWDVLKEYYFDSENLAGNESLDISQYSNEIVLIKFTLHSNDITTGLGYGWLISNIYLGYDKSTDFIAPTIEIKTPLSDEIVSSVTKIEANLSDNIEIDENRINIYINDEMIDKSLLKFDRGTGVLSFEWDTTLYSDGTYLVMVVAYDAEGNRAESVVHVEVENGLMNFQTWGIWFLIIVGIIMIGIISYVLAEKYGKFSFRHRRNTFAEKLRLKDLEKEQVIKRIEIIETPEEHKNPLILHCKYCQSWFESSKFNYMCPKC